MTEKRFQINEHGVDRTLRLIAGLAILSMAFIGPKTPWAYGGLILVFTGVVGMCPIYRALGISTAS